MLNDANIVSVLIEARPEKEIKEDELPTKIQQGDLIAVGKELCGFLRDVVAAEAQESAIEIQKDIDSIIQMGKKQISLMLENYSMKLSCTNNDVKSRGFHESIPKLREEAEASLGDYKALVTEQTSHIANRIEADAMKLEEKGQDILNEFLECSRKGTLSMFSCYKRTIGVKLNPLKEFLMNTVKAHSKAHSDFLKVRSSAVHYIQQKLKEFENKLEAMFQSYRN
ncbi:hypothetical protein HHI36_007754 [Cryptolaemus montrouzieri]|uniref:Uncharacterized protein n=1 Tax=Cryptolaemus montrouzieri TaxID=559131 RepID=A0ABD2MQH9_9CUCU